MTELNKKLTYSVGFNYSCDHREISSLCYELKMLMEKEATTLYRMARKADKHGCSKELTEAIRTEARYLHSGDIEYIVNPFAVWHFAFYQADERRRPSEPDWEG